MDPRGSRNGAAERILYIYGAAALRELNTFLEQGSADLEDRKVQIRNAWRGAASKFQGMQVLDEVPENVKRRELGTEALVVAEKVEATRTFQQTFANFPCRFEEIELDLLVATQRQVNLSHVARLRESFQHEPASLARLCLHPFDDPPQVRTARTPAGYALASEHPGLGVLGVADSPYAEADGTRHVVGGQLVHVVRVLVGFPIATMCGLRIGERVVLSNGFHRAYMLRSIGVTWVPLLIMECKHPDLELPEVLADSSVRYLATARRPPLVKDFFDPDLVCEISAPMRTKSLQLTIQVNESHVPRAV